MNFDARKIVENKALDILQKGQLPDERPIRLLFQIMIMPSFENCESWQVYQQENSTIVVLTYWDRISDFEKLEILGEQLSVRNGKSTLPTIIRKQAELSSNDLNNIISSFENMKLPLMPSDNSFFGCDGTTYSIQFGDLFNNSYFKWWESGPDNWRELIQLTARAYAILSTGIVYY